MAPLIVVNNLEKSFGSRLLFKGLRFAIEPRERIGLIGPNGAGKSTLMRILAGLESQDSGEVTLNTGLKMGFLEQVPQFQEGASILEVLLGVKTAQASEIAVHEAHKLISRFELPDASTLVQALSGGWKKRVALARELMNDPELLLLDEPTNHLDIESILWLEQFLARSRFATLTVTHDRYFLQSIANRFLELDRRNEGGILSVQGNFETYLDVKSQNLASLAQKEATLKNTYRRELEWLRQGAKARSTKQVARIKRAADLEGELQAVQSRNQSHAPLLQFQTGKRSPRRLIEAKNLSKSQGGRLLFEDLSIVLRPGVRLGVLGYNGCGKSTLIQILVGKLKADVGTVTQADGVSIAYFEQNRDSLDPDSTLLKSLCPDGDTVEFQGKKIHIRSYLDRFLFSSEQMSTPIKKLSGGEQSRVLIARLMLQPAQILVLDEPTNDLDLTTLQVLEDCLVEFSGAILLVSHDRFFVDRVCTELLAFPPSPEQGVQTSFFSSLEQWKSWHSKFIKTSKTSKKSQKVSLTPLPVSKKSIANTEGKRRLTFKEQKEWDAIETMIHEAEGKLEQLGQDSLAAFESQSPEKWQSISESMANVQDEIDQLYARWSELEAIKL